MANFLVKKENKNKEIVFMEYSIPGYIFTPKKNLYSINIKNIKVIDKKLAEEILTIKFEKNFRKLVLLVNNFFNDVDASDSDGELVLGEIELIREILLNRYHKFIKKEKEILFLKKLEILEKEVKSKEILIKNKILLEQLEEEKCKGR